MATDDLDAYLDEAVSRALGNAPKPVVTDSTAASSQPAANALTARVARKIASTKAGGVLRAATGSAEHLRVLRVELDALQESHHRTWVDAMQVPEMRDEFERRLSALHVAIAGVELALEDVTKTLETIEANEREDNGQLVDAAEMDSFYSDFEEAFRGSRDEIRTRLEVWLPLAKPLVENGQLALDVACGRGEWLELLKEHGIKAYGVDTNAEFVQLCAEQGVDVVHADALEYLESIDPDSIALLTAFQFVEHLTLPDLVRLLRLSFRAVMPGGIILLETPNPSNLRVSGLSFYLDPTHRRPLHPDFLRFAIERAGFVETGVHWVNEVEGAPDDLDEHTRWALFGPQDYAIAARKPSE